MAALFKLSSTILMEAENADLYDANGNRISSGNIPSSGKVLLASNLELKTGENKSYTVLIWLQDNGKNQDYEQGKNFAGEFYITTEQIKYE